MIKGWVNLISSLSNYVLKIADNPNVLNNIGLCYSKLAKDDLASEFFIKTLSFNPKSVQTYINLADVYYRNKNIVEAINLLENGVTLMPQEIALKHYLSRFYVEDCRYDLAMDQLFEILDIDEEYLKRLVVRYAVIDLREKTVAVV